MYVLAILYVNSYEWQNAMFSQDVIVMQKLTVTETIEYEPQTHIL